MLQWEKAKGNNSYSLVFENKRIRNSKDYP